MIAHKPLAGVLAASLALGLAAVVPALAPPAAAGEPPKGPVQVFVLAGQSNMEGHGKVEQGHDKVEGGVGSLRHVAAHPPKGSRVDGLAGADGAWAVRDDVWVWATTDRGESGRLTVGFGARDTIGPEFGFGHVVGEALAEPVLLIKTAWGGKDLAVDFRPPSAGKVTCPLGKKRQAAIEAEPDRVGRYYRLMLRHVREVTGNLGETFPALAGRRCEIAGFGWHQGWNDGCNGEFVKEYEANLAHLIRDLRKEWKRPDLPVVVATSGFGGWENTNARRVGIMEAQRAVADPKTYPEFAGTVAAVETRPFWRPKEVSPSGQGYHWNHNAETHFLIGEAMGRAMVKLLKR